VAAAAAAASPFGEPFSSDAADAPAAQGGGGEEDLPF